MVDRSVVDDILLLLAIKLAQPGRIADVEDAYGRLEPVDMEPAPSKRDIKAHLERLIHQKHVWLYAGSRYMLTRAGERYVALSGLRLDLDMRRLYLLKETRMRSVPRRGDTHDWPLKQQP